MGTDYYRIVDDDGTELGWCAYQRTTDVWYNETFPDLEALREWKNHRQCDRTCSRAKVRPVTLHEGGEEDYTQSGRWCSTCSAFVPPPFDGYVHHEYDCACGKCDGMPEPYRRGLQLMSEALERQCSTLLADKEKRVAALTAENHRLHAEVSTWRDEVARLHDELRARKG